ncbi:MAG: hypothetical protein R2873_08785 [Caldilineaceae bacterium]
MLQPHIVEKMEPHLSPKSRESLSTIAAQADRAAALIRQVLDFSRASHMSMQPVDLVEVLDG